MPKQQDQADVAAALPTDAVTGSAGPTASADSTATTIGESSVPPVIGACDNLGTPGIWEDIAPKASDTGQGIGVVNAQAIALDPFHVGTIWLGASSVYPKSAGGLYKSSDCGATWTHVNTGMNGDKLDTAAIWSMAVDEVVEGTIYVVGAYGPWNLWKSTDGGVNFTSLLPDSLASDFAGNTAASITVDPDDHLHLVVAPHGKCAGAYAPICNAESTDGGAHWRLVTIPGSDWGEATGPYLLNATSWLSTLGGLWLTTDNGAHWTDVKPTGVNYVTGGEYTHRPLRKSPRGNYYLPTQQDNGLITSTDGVHWTHIANTPNGSYELAFAMGGGRLYLGDKTGNDYQVADEATPSVWTKLASPPAGSLGPVNLEYDEAHHLLYSSNFEGGMWRLVTP